MWTYRPQLDGLRSVAVYLVLVFHCGVAALAGGFIGVDVFFVLSGFLVTNVMLEEIRSTGTLSLGRFYARRVRRLLPAAVLVVVATCLLFVLVASVTRRLEIVGDARAALLYVANWHFLGQSNDYFAQEDAASPFLHFWSLAIEEQFYVVFPVVLLLLARRARRRLRTTALVVAALGLASLGAQLYWMSADPNHAYYGTDARLYQLLAGALLAVLLVGRPRLADSRWGSAPVAGAGALLGLAGLGVLGSGLVDVVPGWRGLGATVATVAVIAGITLRSRSWLARALARPVPVYLGTISYGTYLWHWPVILVLRELLELGPLATVLVATPLATGLAALSFAVLESPIRRAPALAGSTWTVVVTGLAVSVVAALVVVPPVLQSDRRPALPVASGAAATGSVGDEPVPTGIDWRAQLRDNGKGASCTAEDVEECVVVDGPGPRVLLVGDSFANMLGPMFEALAEDHGFSLAQEITQGCPWPEDVENRGESTANQELCRQARDGWYDEVLPELDPDLVVLVMRPRDLEGRTDLGDLTSRSGRDVGTVPELLWPAMRDTVDGLVAQGRRVLLVQSVMGTGGERPLDCLSAAERVSQCLVDYPLERPASDGYMEALDAASDQVSTISLDPVVCPTAPVCAPYRDGRIVWRDRYHLMTTFATGVRDDVWDLVEESGATRALR